jgi:hypothetical protein
MNTNVSKLLNWADSYISRHNPGYNNPYHNNEHMKFVKDMSLDIFDDYLTKHKESELFIEQGTLILGLSALFHDFDHFGKASIDLYNIKKAIDGFQSFIIDYKIKERFNDINILIIEKEVISLIESTEFPHKPVADSALFIHIIRDADLLPGVSDGWEEVVKNICKEMNKTIDQWRPIQIKFISNLQFKTDLANQIYEEKRNDVLEKLKELK